MLTGAALSLYMCQNSRNKYLRSLASMTTTEAMSADFCYPFKTLMYELNPPEDKKSVEMNAHTFDDNLIRRIQGPMDAPKRFHRTNKHKKENKKKWTCRCSCSKHETAEECSVEEENTIQILNKFCDDEIRRQQKIEDERDAEVLKTCRDEPLVPSDGEDCVVAPWPAGGRVDEDVNSVVGREEGWCLIEHDVKVDGAKDLLEGVKGQAR